LRPLAEGVADTGNRIPDTAHSVPKAAPDGIAQVAYRAAYAAAAANGAAHGVTDTAYHIAKTPQEIRLHLAWRQRAAQADGPEPTSQQYRVNCFARFPEFVAVEF
jgi:hypothetical protein